MPRQFKELESILKRNYKNVLQQQVGALISRTRQIGLEMEFMVLAQRMMLILLFQMECPIHIVIQTKKISISIMQKYLLNTFKIWLWDLGYCLNEGIRFYKIIFYAVLNGVQTKIYDSNLATSIVIIAFPDQFAERFDVLNVGGNTYNTDLRFINAYAYYKFS